METKTEILVLKDRCVRRVITEERIRIEDSLAEKMAASVRRVALYVAAPYEEKNSPFEKYYGLAHLMVGPGGDVWWTVPIRGLSLRAPFDGRDGVLWPAFDKPDMPQFEMRWAPPEDMKLVLGIGVTDLGVHSMVLVAFNDAGDAWRLPLSNVYDNGSLCWGRTAIQGDTMLHCLREAVECFEKSSWNSDLYAERTLEHTKLMFSFKANGEKFEQVPAPKIWTSICEKVSTKEIEEMLVP
jgi:hypothetical protein